MTKEFSQIQHRRFPIINNEKHSNFFQKTTLFQLQQNESQLPLRISSTNIINKFKAHNSQHLINRGCRTIVLHLLETNLTSDLYQWPWTSSVFEVNLCRWRETYNCKLPSMTKQKNPFPYLLLKKVITTDLKYYSLKQIKIDEKHLNINISFYHSMKSTNFRYYRVIIIKRIKHKKHWK